MTHRFVTLTTHTGVRRVYARATESLQTSDRARHGHERTTCCIFTRWCGTAKTTRDVRCAVRARPRRARAYRRAITGAGPYPEPAPEPVAYLRPPFDWHDRLDDVLTTTGCARASSTSSPRATSTCSRPWASDRADVLRPCPGAGAGSADRKLEAHRTASTFARTANAPCARYGPGEADAAPCPGKGRPADCRSLPSSMLQSRSSQISPPVAPRSPASVEPSLLGKAPERRPPGTAIRAAAGSRAGHARRCD